MSDDLYNRLTYNSLNLSYFQVTVPFPMFNYMGANQKSVQDGVKKYGLAVGARKMIDNEYLHAQESLKSKVYITYWNEEKKQQCFRLGSRSQCFCGHKLSTHNESYFGKKFNTACNQKGCLCKKFQYVPTRPEQCGMYWLVRRKDFDVNSWKPPCKCKHTTAQHKVNYPRSCKKCSCYDFNSYFACLTCDGSWQSHEVLYQIEEDRLLSNKKIGQDYLPLSQHKHIQNEVFKKETSKKQNELHKALNPLRKVKK